MNFKANNTALELYLRHIVQEVFPKEFLLQNDSDFSLHFEKNSSVVSANVSFFGLSKKSSEIILHHPSENIATTCAIGKAVIDIGREFGFKEPPYGVLTGVRPLKIASSLYSGEGVEQLSKLLYDKYLVSFDKSELLHHCVFFDNKIRESHSKKDVSLYISIPFCPSRCYYCSFVSSDIEKKKALLPEYLAVLCEEIEKVSETVRSHGLNVKSLYIGGGTPGVLSSEQIQTLLTSINKSFKIEKEFTFEIGRPETVTLEKLKVLKFGGVNRLSVNTQTTNDEVLKAIGRRHSAEQYFRAVELALGVGFDSVNTDIIAGLENESFDSFKKSLCDVVSTGVNNITVHTLCVKKSSELKELKTNASCECIDDFIAFSKDFCISSDFLPYYLYRQKYSLGNHESVGYCKDEKIGYYNIAMMNEIESVIGIGAGATSRIISNNSGEKHVHLENYKYPTEYIRDKSKMYAHINAVANALNND